MTSPSPPVVSALGQALYDSLHPLTRGDAALGYPLLRLCDALCHGLDDVDALGRDTAAGPGWSQVMDPARAPTDALPWLGMFVGSIVDPNASDTDQRAQVAAESGFGRGTPAALLAAARRYLTGSQVIALTERDLGDPYLLTVVVYGQQIAGQSYGDLSGRYPLYSDLGGAFSTYASFASGTDELILALQAAKPAGLRLNLVVTAGQLYSDLTAGTYNTYAKATAHYATYGAMTAAPPGS